MFTILRKAVTLTTISAALLSQVGMAQAQFRPRPPQQPPHQQPGPRPQPPRPMPPRPQPQPPRPQPLPPQFPGGGTEARCTQDNWGVECTLYGRIQVNSPDDYGNPVGGTDIETLMGRELQQYSGYRIVSVEASGRVSNRGGGQVSAMKHWPDRGDGVPNASTAGQSLLNGSVYFDIAAWNITVGYSARNLTLNATGYGTIDRLTVRLDY